MAKKKSAPEPALPAESSPAALKSLRELDARLTQRQGPVVKDLQALLDGLANQSFGSLEANEAVVAAVQRLLHRPDLRAVCPRCGEPAIPRCRATGNAKDGSFQSEHSHRGRQTNHMGSTTFPAFRLMPNRRLPPPRGRGRVFPTSVGVNPPLNPPRPARCSLPHERGGEPVNGQV
jgi:hypothetical protein